MTEKVEALHRRIDKATQPLEERHQGRLTCKLGCSTCCVDGLTVWEVEAEVIREHFSRFLIEEEPHPVGACAFLDNAGACRIYEHRPYVCRTQGLPLRWLDEYEGDWVEFRDICELNEAGEPLESLPESACWSLGEVEAELASLQSERGEMERVALRSLFEKPIMKKVEP